MSFIYPRMGTHSENAPQDSQKTAPHQKRVDESANSSTQTLIDTSESQRRVTLGERERYFP